MKICLIGSMLFVEKFLDVVEELKKFGHHPVITPLYHNMVGKGIKEKEKAKLYNKYHRNAIRVFWNEMQDADAVLVLNYTKNGIKNYIGANTFLEMGFAHVLNQKIFVLNPLPRYEFYKSEIKAMKPIVIRGDLKKIK